MKIERASKILKTEIQHLKLKLSLTFNNFKIKNRKPFQGFRNWFCEKKIHFDKINVTLVGKR